jgi:hypothetical protein
VPWYDFDEDVAPSTSRTNLHNKSHPTNPKMHPKSLQNRMFLAKNAETTFQWDGLSRENDEQSWFWIIAASTRKYVWHPKTKGLHILGVWSSNKRDKKIYRKRLSKGEQSWFWNIAASTRKYV